MERELEHLLKQKDEQADLGNDGAWTDVKELDGTR